MEYAQKLYDKNLSLLLETIRKDRRGLYRVMMDSSGLIISIKACRLGPPQHDTFTVYVPGKSQKPKFGSFNCLRGFQPDIAKQLERDISTILHSNEVATVLQMTGSPVLDKTGQKNVHELEKRFGQLPKASIQRYSDQEKERRLVLEQDAEQKEKVWNEHVPDFYQVLEEERVFLEPRARTH